MFIYTLPYTDENYSVDIKNKILLKNNIAIENSDTYDLSECWGEKCTAIDIETLCLIAMGGTFFTPEFFHLLKGVLFETYEDVFVGHWVHEPIESSEYKDHYYIPSHEEYLITKDGKVLSLKRNEPLYLISRTNTHARYNKQRGIYISYVLDGKSFFLHRLLMLTFCPPTKDKGPVSLLQVNHIDGIKDNNCLDNLEWCTPKENNWHSVLNNLGLSSGGVEILDIDTMQIHKFDITYEADRVFQLTPTLTHGRCQSTEDNGFKIFDKKYLFRFTKSDKQFPSKEEIAGLKHANKPTKVTYTYDVFTKDLIQFDNVKVAAVECGVSATHVSNYANGTRTQYNPINGYFFYKEDTLPEKFPEYTELQLKYIQLCIDLDKPIKRGIVFKRMDTENITIFYDRNDMLEQLQIPFKLHSGARGLEDIKYIAKQLDCTADYIMPAIS